MAVYVDNMLRRATVGRTTSDWSHLLADTSEELHEFAARLGLKREWCQHEGTRREHYDLTRPKRNKAIDLGAVPIRYPRETGELIMRRKLDDLAEVDRAKADHLNAAMAAADHPYTHLTAEEAADCPRCSPSGLPRRIEGGDETTLSKLAHAGQRHALVSGLTRDPDPAPKHEYQRDPQSGAGNCVCGMSERHRRHPHEFLASMTWDLCTCSMPRQAKCHQTGETP